MPSTRQAESQQGPLRGDRRQRTEVWSKPCPHGENNPLICSKPSPNHDVRRRPQVLPLRGSRSASATLVGSVLQWPVALGLALGRSRLAAGAHARSGAERRTVLRGGPYVPGEELLRDLEKLTPWLEWAFEMTVAELS